MSSPTAGSSSLIRRGGDGVYLTNCGTFGVPFVWSQFSYSRNFGQSQNEQFPDDTVRTANGGFTV
jgi:hypothetical protein